MYIFIEMCDANAQKMVVLIEVDKEFNFFAELIVDALTGLHCILQTRKLTVVCLQAHTYHP